MWVRDLSARNGGDMELLDAMQIRQRKGKPFPLFRCDKLIDIDCVNWLIAVLIATTVAKRLPASSKTGKKDASHDGYLSCGCGSGYRFSRGVRHHRPCRLT
jgi:hypothetical protein